MKRVTSHLSAAGLILLAVGLTSAIGQTDRYRRGPADSPETVIRKLEETVRLHGLRIEQLEARAARQDPTFLDNSIAESPRAAQAPRPAPGRPARIMILDGVEPVEADPAAQEELEQLEREAEALTKTADQMQRRANSMSGGSGYRRRAKYVGPGRRRVSAGELSADYQTQARNKRGELKRLERELNEPKQMIQGHWGDQIITLETTRDLSRTLDRMDRGGYLTWEGRRLREDEDSQNWIVTRIDSVDPSTVDAKE